MADTQTEQREGYFGSFGGCWVPETLVPAAQELAQAWAEMRVDPAFRGELDELLSSYVGRPTPLGEAAGLTRHAGGARIWLKREDLAHTGSHKINNALGQALLARHMGKRRIIAETGAGQHGVASATACALLGLDCIVYMGAADVERQHPNVERMRLLGAEVRPVEDGSRTLKDAINAAIRDWVTNVGDTYYLIGSVVGMHPYPTLVRELQSVIGTEVRRQIQERVGRLPDAVVACVGGGSNAIGTFFPFVSDTGVALHGAEAAGEGLETGRHSATLVGGSDGVLHGARTFVLQDEDGQVIETHSISAGLDYPGVGPEHAWLHSTGRAQYHPVTDAEALAAFGLLCRSEGIVPALESAHAIALATRLAGGLRKDAEIVVCLSGRGDKDLATVLSRLEETR